MIAFPGMLVKPAEKAGMKVPDDPDNFSPGDFVHFTVFCNMQIGASMPYPSCVWDNAEVLAAIPEDELKTMLWCDIVARGYHVST
jgi:hypothetical protein